MAKFNITQAAQFVGVSRSTIQRRIKAGSLSTEQDKAGKVVIDQSELLRVFGEAKEVHRDPSLTASRARSRVSHDDDPRVQDMQRQIEHLQGEVQFLRAQVQRAEDRYDRLLQAPPPTATQPPPAAPAPQKKSLLDRLLGR